MTKLEQAMKNKRVYIGKDGITLKQLVAIRNLGYQVIFK